MFIPHEFQNDSDPYLKMIDITTHYPNITKANTLLVASWTLIPPPCVRPSRATDLLARPVIAIYANLRLPQLEAFWPPNNLIGV